MHEDREAALYHKEISWDHLKFYDGVARMLLGSSMKILTKFLYEVKTASGKCRGNQGEIV